MRYLPRSYSYYAFIILLRQVVEPRRLDDEL